MSATLFIEFLHDDKVMGETAIAVTSSSAQSTAAPNFDNAYGGVARCTADGAAIMVQVGVNPVADNTVSYRLEPGETKLFPIKPGSLVAAILSTTTGTGVGGLAGAAAPSVAAVTAVASSAASVQLLAANAPRKAASVFNDDNNVLYLALGAGPATTAAYTVQVLSGGYFELPAGFTGAVQGLWSAAGGGGSARVTELT